MPTRQPAAPVVKKQSLNVYTVMLIVSFFCMMIASILFYIELSKFDGWWNTGSAEIRGSVGMISVQFPGLDNLLSGISSLVR